MNDLISRQAAIDVLETVGYDFSDSELSEIELEEVCEAVGDIKQDMINRIKRITSAQQEIISCKDCKHLQKWRSEESAKRSGQIYTCARNVFSCPEPEDFCSFAERRAEQ